MFESSVRRMSIAAIALFVQLGCENSRPSAPVAVAGPKRALVAFGGANDGGGVTLFLPSTDPENPVTLRAAGTKVCPECKAAAVRYFKTGELDRTCARTGATRTPTFGSPTSDLLLQN